MTASNDGEKKWTLAPRRHADLVTHLLALRGIDDPTAFLSPDYTRHLHDPLLMKDMAKTIDRLVLLIRTGEPIGVYADYDSDGTPGAALFVDGLRQLGLPTPVYVPQRFEGYGLHRQGIDQLFTLGTRTMVTIDLGITAKEETAYAAELGMDVIITDHHVVQPDQFPRRAYAVINPKQADCPYPFKDLCGGGVIWKVFCALIDALARLAPALLRGRNPEALKRWALDLAAISTICDMVPLIGENRVIAQYGLTVLRKTRRPGLRALLQTIGSDPAVLTAGTVGFQIGPRINAPTRLAAANISAADLPGSHVSLALGLLVSQTDETAHFLASELDRYNRERQQQLEQALAIASARVRAEGLAERNVIVLADPRFPVGIVGLIASRLTEAYDRPAVVFGFVGDEAVGSARSVDGVHLVDILHELSPILTKFGGHAKAAGLSIGKQHLKDFDEQLERLVGSLGDFIHASPRVVFDAELGRADLTQATAVGLAQFEPFGIGNPRPLFFLPRVRLKNLEIVGRTSQHLKGQIEVPGHDQRLGVIGFGLAHRRSHLAAAGLVDAAVYLGLNEWNGQRRLDLQLKDVRPTEPLST